MKPSPDAKVRELYEESANQYSAMMDREIDLPVHAKILDRLAGGIATIKGPIVDTSSGSGHMLSRYHDRHDPKRPLIGIDLSPGSIPWRHNPW